MIAFFEELFKFPKMAIIFGLMILTVAVAIPGFYYAVRLQVFAIKHILDKGFIKDTQNIERKIFLKRFYMSLVAAAMLTGTTMLLGEYFFPKF